MKESERTGFVPVARTVLDATAPEYAPTDGKRPTETLVLPERLRNG